MRSEAVIIPLH